jgi:hypothetical protein
VASQTDAGAHAVGAEKWLELLKEIAPTHRNASLERTENYAGEQPASFSDVPMAPNSSITRIYNKIIY